MDWKEKYEQANAGWKSAIADLQTASELCRGIEQERDALKDRVAELERQLEAEREARMLAEKALELAWFNDADTELAWPEWKAEILADAAARALAPAAKEGGSDEEDRGGGESWRMND